MFRKLLVSLWFAEVLEQAKIEQPINQPVELTWEQKNQERLSELWFAQKEEKPKEKRKYVMFSETAEEKEKWKNYFRNLIDWYERVKGKRLIAKHFIDQVPTDKKEKFHWFLHGTQEIAKISNKVCIAENKKLKKSLYSNKNHD